MNFAEAEKARWSLKEALRPGFEALKKFWAPFLLIQLGAAALVVAYYFVPSVQAFAEGIVELRGRLGLLFSALGGFLAGGVVPEIAKALTGKIKKFDGKWLRDTAFGGFIYLVVAVEVDLFYRLQALMFGTGVDPATVIIKTTVDMGLLSPLLCMPTGVVLCDLRDARWNPITALRRISWPWYRDRVVPTLIPGWGFWIPFLACVYALPLTLQLPLSILGEAAWSMLFIFIATRPAISAPLPETPCPTTGISR